MDPHMFYELSQYFVGMKRDKVHSAQRRNEDLREGKLEFPFKLYRYLAFQAFVSGRMDLHFIKSFGVFSWNVCCRTSNTISILYKHLAWGEDILLVHFCQRKNDEDGSRGRQPKHLYANPTDDA